MKHAQVKCCHCGQLFNERALQGQWLQRSCPICRAQLNEEAYDQAAQHILQTHRPHLGKRGIKQLNDLAFGRYYTSEWFRLSCAGQGSEAADRGLFGLRPQYDQATGAFLLIPHDEDRSPEGGWGRSAEFAVFDALRAEIVREGSPLAGALLVPGLMFPWLPGQKPKQWGATQRAETDIILFARSCAVVVEVKRRTHHVRVSRDLQHVRERTDAGSFRSASEVIEQVSRGASSLAERQRLYAPEDILRLVVYVDPPSFESPSAAFSDGLLFSVLNTPDSPMAGLTHASALAPFLAPLCQEVAQRKPLATQQDVQALAKDLFQKFGNIHERRQGGIVRVKGAQASAHLRRTTGFLKALDSQTRNQKSPLYGAHLLQNVECQAQQRGKGNSSTMKNYTMTALLLTRTHAVLFDVRRWPVHVNTHVPFATVYTGDPAAGAQAVHDSMRHDWDLQSINYLNRSGSLTLLGYVSKGLRELDEYRDRNRLCTAHVFLDPASFYSDCSEFRQKSFIGYWQGRANNIFPALEQLVQCASPVLSQKQIDKLAAEISA